MKYSTKAIIFVFLLLGQSVARAENADSKFWIGGGAGALGENSETETGLIGGGQAGCYSKYLGASFHALHYNAENKVNNMSKGTLSLTPLMLNVFGRIPLNKDANIRLGGGFSYILVSHELDSEVKTFFANRGFSATEEVSSAMGTQALGGVDIFITEHIALGADIIYLFFKPELKAVLTSISNGASASASADIKLDTIIGTANIKYFF